MHFPAGPIAVERVTADQVFIVEIAEDASAEARPKVGVDRQQLGACIGSQADKRRCQVELSRVGHGLSRHPLSSFTCHRFPVINSPAHWPDAITACRVPPKQLPNQGGAGYHARSLLPVRIPTWPVPACSRCSMILLPYSTM